MLTGIPQNFKATVDLRARSAEQLQAFGEAIRTPTAVTFQSTEVVSYGDYEYVISAPEVAAGAFHDNFEARSDGTWGIPFTVGKRLCVTGAHVCGLSDRTMVAVQFSDVIRPFPKSELGAHLTVHWGEALAECKPNTSLSLIGGNEFSVDCSLAPTEVATATIAVEVESETGVGLTNCAGKAAESLRLALKPGECTRAERPEPLTRRRRSLAAPG